MQQRNYGALQSFCSLPWFNLHVKASGDVYPCCALLTPGFRPFGNIHDQGLREIWEGEAYSRFRQSHEAFTRATREGDRRALQANVLPRPCTVHGMCFLRALPYVDDTPFAVAVDALGRRNTQADVRFPNAMRDGEWAVLAGVDPATAGPLQIFINRLQFGNAIRGDGTFSIGFRPEPLGPGFHLLEVRDDAGRVLASRMVEKLGQHP